MLKNGDDSDSDEKKEALLYLEEAQNKKQEYISGVLDSLGEEISKHDLIEKIKDSFFQTYKLRMAITGRKMASQGEQPPAPV